MLPTFLVIGAQKAATTMIDALLRQHPDIAMPRGLKETNYLIDEGNWHRGRGWYESLWAGEGETTRHRGEVSPGYTMFPTFLHAPERAAELVPEARLVYVVRHPVDRMVSAWVQATTWGLEHRNLETALLESRRYADVSSYGMQLAQWLGHFDRSQVLVMRFEDLDDLGSATDRLLEHVGLPSGWRPSTQPARLNESLGRRVPRAPAWVAARALRSAGRARAANQVGSRGGRWIRRPLLEAEMTLDPDLRNALTETFRADLALLRSLVGAEVELWGLA